MRIFVAIVVCVFLGALAFELTGVGLGLLVGLVGGLIWHGHAKQAKAEKAGQATPSGIGDAGPTSLELRVATLEARIYRLERAVAGSPAATAAMAAGASPVPETAGGLTMAATAAVAPPASLAAAADALHPAYAAYPASGREWVEPGLAVSPSTAQTGGPDDEPIDSRSPAGDAGMSDAGANAAAGAAALASQSTLPPEPPQPAKPTLIQRLLSGNVFAKIGTIILFFAVSFAIKFALENELVPIEAWLALAALGAVVLLIAGWKLRGNETGYGLILQGGGVGILYLVTFGALKLYHLLPPTMAFVILVALTVLSAILAILQNSVALAAVGVTGGFLAPILASTGSGNHVALFTYYAILNAGIVLIAWFKAWRILNVLGFVFTVLISVAWGQRHYTPDLLWSTEPFLILFFAMYVGIAILFATRSAPNLKHYVDGTIVFGTPITVFGMQAAMVHHIPYAMAFSALAMGWVYVLLASILYTRHKETLRLLVESFFALALIFGTLSVPLALEPKWTSAAWAVEGAAVLWAGLRQQRVLARVFGLLVQLGGALAFLTQIGQMPSGDWIFVNSSGLGMTMIALAALFTAWQLDRHAGRITAVERQITGLVFGWGALWWLALGITEIDRHVPNRWLASAGLVFLAVSGVAFSIASTKLAWPIARWPALLLLPLYLLLALIAPDHPFAGAGWLMWPIALGVHYWLLRRHDDENDGHYGRAWLGAVHVGSLLLVALLGSWELHWWPAHHGLARSAWTVAAAMVVPALLLMLVGRVSLQRWPLSAYPDHYLLRAGPVLAIALIAWMWFANATHDGTSAPLPYMPLINALDLGHVLALIAIATWWLRLRELGAAITTNNNNAFRIVAGATVFVWLNAILLRTLHHWFWIPYTFDALWGSLLVQASLSIFWTVLAFALMLVARKRGERLLWTIGAVLMGVVVVKLFLADLSNLSGIIRIVAFLGVGALMVVMGYFVPLPPQRPDAMKEESA